MYVCIFKIFTNIHSHQHTHMHIIHLHAQAHVHTHTHTHAHAHAHAHTHAHTDAQENNLLFGYFSFTLKTKNGSNQLAASDFLPYFVGALISLQYCTLLFLEDTQNL